MAPFAVATVVGMKSRTVLVVALLALGTIAVAPVASAGGDHDRFPCWSGPEWTHPAGLGKCQGCDCDLEGASSDRQTLA